MTLILIPVIIPARMLYSIISSALRRGGPQQQRGSRHFHVARALNVHAKIKDRDGVSTGYSRSLLDIAQDTVTIHRGAYKWEWFGRITATLIYMVQATSSSVLSMRRLQHDGHLAYWLDLHNFTTSLSAFLTGTCILAVLAINSSFTSGVADGTAAERCNCESAATRERRSNLLAALLHGILFTQLSAWPAPYHGRGKLMGFLHNQFGSHKPKWQYAMAPLWTGLFSSAFEYIFSFARDGYLDEFFIVPSLYPMLCILEVALTVMLLPERLWSTWSDPLAERFWVF